MDEFPREQSLRLLGESSCKPPRSGSSGLLGLVRFEKGRSLITNPENPGTIADFGSRGSGGSFLL